MNEKHKRSMIIQFNDDSKKLLGVDFLCAPAAAQIRGIALPVDGRWTAQ